MYCKNAVLELYRAAERVVNNTEEVTLKNCISNCIIAPKKSQFDYFKNKNENIWKIK